MSHTESLFQMHFLGVPPCRNGLLRRLSQKCANPRFYPFAMPLIATLRCLARDFCNSLRSSSTLVGAG